MKQVFMEMLHSPDVAVAELVKVTFALLSLGGAALVVFAMWGNV